MLATMVKASRPTRAEVTDVANAIHDGTDAVMLSEETAVGEHPVEAVRVMDRIARVAEKDLPYDEWLWQRVEGADTDIGEAVAQVAVAATYRLDLAAIVVPTGLGPHGPPRLRLPAARPRAGRCRRTRDRPADEPPLRSQRRAVRALGEPAGPARRLRAARARTAASRSPDS